MSLAHSQKALGSNSEKRLDFEVRQVCVQIPTPASPGCADAQVTGQSSDT